MRRLLTPDQFADVTEQGQKSPPTDVAVYRLAPSDADLTSVDERIIRYVFSTGAVARDNHTVNQNGWDFSGFDLNPVFLFAHDMDQPPIGKVVEHVIRGGALVGAVHYIERDIYPFADMIFQMVRNRYLNAVSTSWLPIEWKWSQDKSRLGGIDFIKQDMLEISQAPVPAQITAIATARAAGIDTGPMVEWVEQLLDRAAPPEIVQRSVLEQWRREAKMPLPAKVKKNGAARETELACQTADQPAHKGQQRGLYEVAELAWLLMQLGWIKDSTEWEAAVEEDGSDIPGRLTKLLNDAGQILVDMTQEEVAELLAEKNGDAVEVLEQSAKTDGQHLLVGLLRAATVKRSGPVVTEINLPDDFIQHAVEKIAAELRAGKVLSAANVTALNRAMECHREMGDCVQGVLDAASTELEPIEQHAPATESEDEQIATRVRKADAIIRLHKAA